MLDRAGIAFREDLDWTPARSAVAAI